MIVAWMFCSSIGTTIARFYKPVWNGNICGTKVWFQVLWKHLNCFNEKTKHPILDVDEYFTLKVIQENKM